MKYIFILLVITGCSTVQSPITEHSINGYDFLMQDGEIISRSMGNGVWSQDYE